MTVNLKLDADGKLIIVKGAPVLVDSTVQRVNTRLRMLMGEWFLDLADGVPYLQRILVANVNLDHVRSYITNRVLNTEGVKGIQSLDLTFDKVRRKLTIQLKAVGPQGAFQVTL